MGPAIFGVSVMQISVLISTIFASYLAVGSLSWLYYSERIIYLPVGVFGVALATVVLPSLSRHHVRQETKLYSANLDWGLRMVCVLALPAAAGALVLGGPILATLFQYGVFQAHDVMMSERSLMAYALGMPAFMLVKMLASGFYSRQDIKTPVKVAVMAVVLNVILNALLIKPLAHAGLALATSLSSWFNAVLLLILIVRSQAYVPQHAWWLHGVRSVLATASMAALLWWQSPPIQQWLAWSAMQRAWHLGALLAVGILCYALVLWCSGMRWRQFQAEAMNKVQK